MSMRSPTFRLGTAWNHFLRAVKPGKYSCNHLFQMWMVMTCACRQRFWLDISLSAKIPGGKLGVALPIRKWFRVNASTSFASELTSVNGRLLTRDSTSVIAVNNTSSVVHLILQNNVKGFLAGSHQTFPYSPMWGAAGRLNTH